MIKIQTEKSIAEISNYIAFELENAVQQNGSITIAFSGGNTPKAIFNEWKENFAHKNFWNKISYFWVDERCVNPASEESNFGVAKALFFEPLKISQSQIFRIKGENSPPKEAIRYHQILRKKTTLINSIPQLDFIFLGIGDDGHTASIFPGNENLFETDSFCVATQNPNNLQNRITLTGKVINNAKRVIFIVTGNSKREIIKEIIKKSFFIIVFPN